MEAARKWIKRTLTGLVVAGGVAALVLAWLPKPVEVDLATVKRGPLRVTVEEDGKTRVKDRYTVSAPLRGSLARIELHAGDSIKAGDIVARLVPVDPPLMDARSRAQAEGKLAAAIAAQRQSRASVVRAKAAKDHAGSQLERQNALAKKSVVSVTALEEAEFAHKVRTEELTSAVFGERVADYEAKVARAALQRLSTKGKGEQITVTAPVSGRVLRVIQKSEGVIQAGTPLVELGDPQALEIVVDVLTQDAVQIRPGAHAEISRWGGEHAIKGRVRLVEPSAFTELSALGVKEQRINVVIDLTDAAETWKALGDGYRVEVAITVWEAADLLQVPTSAAFRSDAGWAVFVVHEGRASRRRVTLGKRTGLQSEIKEGLAEGARVVLYPSDAVADGVRVRQRNEGRKAPQ